MNLFAKTCHAEFGFLVTKYNFRLAVSEGERDSMASFLRTDALVNVYAEAGSPPWVTVKVGRRDFGLHKAIERIDPQYKKGKPGGERRRSCIMHAFSASMRARSWAFSTRR